MPTVLTTEVAAHALSKVGCLADIEHLVTMPAEHIHAGRAWQLGGQCELGGLGMAGQFCQRDEIVETHYAETGCPFD